MKNGETMSKYDEFWASQIKAVERLIDDAIKCGVSPRLDVSGIGRFGMRSSWSGSAQITRDGLQKGSMAHLTSLANLILQTGLASKFVDKTFRVSISNDQNLRLTRIDKHSQATRDNFSESRSVDQNSHSDSISFDDSTAWDRALANSLPLFATLESDPPWAVFDSKGFFLSPEAQAAYQTIKSKPHIYSARFQSGNFLYFGISNQSGGRWKRAHAYHLGGLAHDILGTSRYDDQDHSHWVREWFLPFDGRQFRSQFVVRMKQPIVISFWQPAREVSRKNLLAIESQLIRIAKKRNLTILNKRD